MSRDDPAGAPQPAPSEPAYASPADYETYGRYDSAARLKRARELAGDDAAAIASLNGFKGRILAADPPVTGRYHLYLNHGCPFCHRLTIAHALLGLEEAVSLSFVDDRRDARGWAFRETYGADPVNGFTLLSQAYEATQPGFAGHISVPVLWDREAGRIVSTESGEILNDLATAFPGLSDPAFDLYPETLRSQIDAFNDDLHNDVNFGVYLVGLAPTQADYDAAIARLFGALDAIEARLSDRPFLFGDALTTSDIRLWVTLARFDVGYYPIFRANLRRLNEYPNLWRYARALYRLPAFAGATDFARYKADYVLNFPQLTPGGIIPAGPHLDWTQP